YWVLMSLKPGESDRQFCRRFKSHLKDWNPFSFCAFASYELTELELGNVKEYLVNWLDDAGKQPVQGESLSLGSFELINHRAPATKRSYPEAGYEVRCSSYTPCTWPWIDFYLKMRRELPAKKRLSIRFFNS
ncbi:MAG TPA: hypothetical protein VMH87_14700, partial [Pseudomonadales bacterium]|nr:hypothetical protein [Pseudomonadales bacterium]